MLQLCLGCVKGKLMKRIESRLTRRDARPGQRANLNAAVRDWHSGCGRHVQLSLLQVELLEVGEFSGLSPLTVLPEVLSLQLEMHSSPSDSSLFPITYQ